MNLEHFMIGLKACLTNMQALLEIDFYIQRTTVLKVQIYGNVVSFIIFYAFKTFTQMIFVLKK